jgi:hypothetical protein
VRGHSFFILGLLLIFPALCAQAVLSPVSPSELQDYQTAVSSPGWATPPTGRPRLFLDVYNVTNFFDSETRGTANFTDQTLLADTIRPTATILWDERFRAQLGVLAERKFGHDVGFQPVEPWIQFLWKPIEPLNVILGDLDLPHYYLPALFYAPNYFLSYSRKVSNIPSNQYANYKNSPVETGAQLLFKKPGWSDDLFFNYQQLDTANQNEKFDLGFVHRNQWKWLFFNYQAHWVHNGGELFPSPIETRNDVAQTAGIDVEYHPFHLNSVIVGGGYSYLHSHLRQEASDPAYTILSTNGDADLWQAFIRWSRLKLTYSNWKGHRFQHEYGDPLYTLPRLNIATVRWDILLSSAFTLYIEDTEYFLTEDSNGYNRYVKTAVLIQASWQFSIPLLEGTSATPRWDLDL